MKHAIEKSTDWEAGSMQWSQPRLGEPEEKQSNAATQRARADIADYCFSLENISLAKKIGSIIIKYL
jgi:hypothetical protein